MHPALSVILFTVVSGAGYGLLALLGLYGATGMLPARFEFGLAVFGLSLGLVTLGLLSSTLHLGHPERAWRAITQWRSSWLSREGVLALLTYIPALIYAYGWLRYGNNQGSWALGGLAAALLAALTVLATGMIYAVLKPVQRWNNPWVPPNCLLLALMTGALWLNTLAYGFGLPRSAVPWTAVIAIVFAWLGKTGYWLYIDRSRGRSSAESATGLAAIGRVRLLEAPHTEENYLMREMGFRIARKHTARLRQIAHVTAFLLPLALTLIAPLFPDAAAFLTLAAALLAMLGVLIERWLFFAEAKHTVTLYYGQSRA